MSLPDFTWSARGYIMKANLGNIPKEMAWKALLAAFLSKMPFRRAKEWTVGLALAAMIHSTYPEYRQGLLDILEEMEGEDATHILHSWSNAWQQAKIMAS